MQIYAFYSILFATKAIHLSQFASNDLANVLVPNQGVQFGYYPQKILKMFRYVNMCILEHLTTSKAFTAIPSCFKCLAL